MFMFLSRSHQMSALRECNWMGSFLSNFAPCGSFLFLSSRGCGRSRREVFGPSRNHVSNLARFASSGELIRNLNAPVGWYGYGRRMVCVVAVVLTHPNPNSTIFEDTVQSYNSPFRITEWFEGDKFHMELSRKETFLCCPTC